MSRKSSRRSEGAGWVLTRGCPRCGRRQEECECIGKSAAAEDSTDGARRVCRLRLELRRGRPLTVLALDGCAAADIDALARELKTRCASGGAVEGVEIELQGEHRDRVRGWLRERGFEVKG